MKEDYAAIQGAGKKRGLWGSIGATLLGGAAMLATGGAAAPIVAGLMAGGGAWAGGHIGNWLAGKTKFGGSGKLTGRKWYGSVGEELGSTIKENINVQALKAGVTATTMAAGGKIGSKLLGKGGPSVTASTGNLEGTNKLGSYAKSLFKGGDTGTQTGFKKLIDYEGSTLGGFFEKAADARHLRKISAADELYGGALGGGGESEFSNFQFGPGELPQGGVEPWQESLYGGVDPNPVSALPKKEVFQGMRKGWLESLEPADVIGSNDFYSNLFGGKK